MREWLVASAIAERLRVEAPFETRATTGRLELTARLTNQATIGVSARAAGCDDQTHHGDGSVPGGAQIPAVTDARAAGHPYGGPSVVVPPAGAAPHDVDATSGVRDRMFS